MRSLTKQQNTINELGKELQHHNHAVVERASSQWPRSGISCLGQPLAEGSCRARRERCVRRIRGHRNIVMCLWSSSPFVILRVCAVHGGSEHPDPSEQSWSRCEGVRARCQPLRPRIIASAPFLADIEQMHVIDHTKGEPSEETRNVLVEALPFWLRVLQHSR